MSREKFLKIYANLPVPERSQIIAIIDDEPFSWNTAYAEISKNTDLGKKILNKMKELRIL